MIILASLEEGVSTRGETVLDEERVNVDPLHSSEGRKNLAVVHVTEHLNRLFVAIDQDLGSESHCVARSVCLVGHGVGDPGTAVERLFIGAEDHLRTDLVVPFDSVGAGVVQGPLEHRSVDLSALVTLLVVFVEGGLAEANLLVNPLVRLDLGLHLVGSDRLVRKLILVGASV